MDHDDESPMGDAVLSTARSMGMIVMALAFGYLFAMLGNMVYPAGPGAMAGGLLGFVLGGVIGFIVTKKYKEYLEDAYEAGLGKAALVPGFMQEGVFGHPEFTLFITVEKLQDQGPDRSAVLDWWSNTDFYVRIKCGRNPVKATCVKHDGQFYETFKLVVEPQDKSVTFELTDQDVFSEDLLGQVAVPVDDLYHRLLESPGGKFQDSAVRLYSEKTRAGCLVVTYRCGTPGETLRTAAMQGVRAPRSGTGPPQPYSSARPDQAAYGTFNYFESNRQIDIRGGGAIHPSAQLPAQPVYGSGTAYAAPSFGTPSHSGYAQPHGSSSYAARV